MNKAVKITKSLYHELTDRFEANNNTNIEHKYIEVFGNNKEDEHKYLET